MSNSVKLSTVTSISPLDGRYADKIEDISYLFSDLNLTLMRLTVEIEWLRTLANEPSLKEIKPLDNESLKFLHNIIAKFDLKDIERIKQIESETNHDVKAIEYFLKEKLAQHKKLSFYQEFIHFSCTSDDINNISYALTMSKARDTIILPEMKKILNKLEKLSLKYTDSPMLSRTHGQAATPTTFGKELANFTYRLTRQYDYLFITPILAKFNGAVGNFSAHLASYPKTDWQTLSRNFIESFKLTYNPYTTQIEPHDWIAEYCDSLARFNTILIGFCRDIWGYISLGYLKQLPKKNEVGSSTMPHKINPIDFENAEGNLGIANALLQHFASKLPISRWQRDLTDSTVMRNLGVAIGHSVLAYRYLLKGLDKIVFDQKITTEELGNHWEVLAEAIQTMMRKHQLKNPYEQMKKLTRGHKIDQKTIHSFIKQLKIPPSAKKELLKLSPNNYLGLASKLTKDIKLI